MWGRESRGGPGGEGWEMRPVPACRSDSGTASPSVHSLSSHSISGATFTFPSCLLTPPPPAKCQGLSETCPYYLPNAYILFNPHESVSHSVMSNSLPPHGMQPTRVLCPWDFPGKSTGAGCHFFLQGIFLTQGSHRSLPSCRQILYHLSHQGNPMTLTLFIHSKTIH